MSADAWRWSWKTSQASRSRPFWTGGRRLGLAGRLAIAHHLVGHGGIDTAQVIHRDFRPTNILVAPESMFGSWISASPSPRNKPSRPEDIAAPMGDWAYMSPEQTGRMNRPVDYRTDFYSLGVMLYRMLTGQLPFRRAIHWNGRIAISPACRRRRATSRPTVPQAGLGHRDETAGQTAGGSLPEHARSAVRS